MTRFCRCSLMLFLLAAAAGRGAALEEIDLEERLDRMAAAGSRPGFGGEALEDAEATAAREWTRLESHLNWRERLRLQEARLRLELFEETNPGAQGEDFGPLLDEMKEELRDAYVDVLGDELERSFAADDVEDAIRERLFGRFDRRQEPSSTAAASTDGWRLRFSPQVGVSDDSYVGAKLRVRAATGRRLWDHVSLTARHRVETGAEELGVKFDNGRFFVALEHEVESEQGRAWFLTLHASF